MDYTPLFPANQAGSLYDPRVERDACGVGFVASARGADAEVLALALDSLCHLSHRGARAADGATGDGAGLLTQLPHVLFQKEVKRLGGPDLAPGELAVAVLFLPPDEDDVARKVQPLITTALEQEGLTFLGWRPVPMNLHALGERAASIRPDIVHVLAGRGPEDTGGDDNLDMERRLYRSRRRFEAALRAESLDEVYVVSFSSRTIVYKGLLMADQLPEFYTDLADPDYETALVVYHQRYSTNTTPTWHRAQPFRMLAHNGEINTLQGNVNWMRAREPELDAACWNDIREQLHPVVDPNGSDSAMLDNALELLTLSGRDIHHAVAMLVPEAWEGITDMDARLKDFYRYHACLMEPWDGPAGLSFSDGRFVGAALDRNGLRPLRYLLTKDDIVIAGSEAGTVSLPSERIARLGKLGPGQMIAVDTATGKIYENSELKQHLAHRRPYHQWADSLVRLEAGQRTAASANGAGKGDGVSQQGDAGGNGKARPSKPDPKLTKLQAAFGYTSEEMTVIVRPMVETAKEPTGSMGDDTPHAVLSFQQRPFFHYFKQRFAEVTNPPIDHLREALVFSLRVLLGPRGNLLDETADDMRLVELAGPLLLDGELAALEKVGATRPEFRTARIPMHFPVAAGPDGLEPAVEQLCREAEAAVDDGAGILILSDRGVDAEQAPIPCLLATAAVHHHLIRAGKRMRVSLVVESGEPREIHHFATLLGYGASAVNPYLALAAVRQLASSGRLRDEAAKVPEQAEERYREAFNGGLLKIMSRMGISTVDSYTGAQIFEAIGLDSALIERCFPGTPSRVEGNGFRDIAETLLHWHKEAFQDEASSLASYGFYKYKKGGELHDYSPDIVKALHNAVMHDVGVLEGNFTESYEHYREFARLAHSGPPSQLRDLLAFRSHRRPIPVDDVEPIEAIVHRFSTGQMSLGALSPECHETLAIAMNRLGARSGSGEGGEDASRFYNERNSAVKQVASGRFGVTPAYLASAEEIQIKMAQGSKPGEGGQIPGHKVTDLIAELRHTVPGVALISPPPHHDIYSIEDLAQLIYDLKQANPEAEVSVKLVAQTGVGIIAAGVAKGYADAILISGASGGTGSSPLNSIKNAGLPWEIGLSETQQTLMGQGLRERIALRVDGGIRTGRDILVAALLGADEFSFGTSAMVSAGCIMARTCHTNRCPVGIASQDPALRAKFPGTPEMVMAYMTFVAQEIRELLAGLGYQRLNDVIGRVELLEQTPSDHPAADRLNLAPLLAVPEGSRRNPRRRMADKNPRPREDRLDYRFRIAARQAYHDTKPVRVEFSINNTDRTVGANLFFKIARRHGDAGLPEGTVQAAFHGTGGQSFGAFCTPGVHMTLIGQANDYVGKSMAGGEIVLRPPEDLELPPHENVIAGNTVLYGATGGTFHASGRVGERFAIRNSGAVAVVEGAGDHACEYMTKGTVVILGSVGYNFGAGMTGGEAFILDEEERLPLRYNDQLIGLHRLRSEDAHRLHELVTAHHEKTGSPKAAALLEDWERAVTRFLRAAPLESLQGVSLVTAEGERTQGDVPAPRAG